MRFLAYASLLLWSIVVGLWVLTRFHYVELSVGTHAQLWVFRTTYYGVIVDRLHPYAAGGGWHFNNSAVSQQIGNFTGFQANTTTLFPGVAYSNVAGISSAAFTPNAVPNCFMNVIAFRWWLVEVAASAATVIIWWRYLARQRKVAQGFPVEV